MAPQDTRDGYGDFIGEVKSLQQVHRDADFGDLDRTVQVFLHGVAGVLIGVVLAITGPNTPSFALLAALPGWPVVYGVTLAVVATVLLVVQWRRGSVRVMAAALAAMGAGYLGVGLAVWATWVLWAEGGHVGSEPLLSAVPVCLLLAVLTGYQGGILALRRRRGAGPLGEV